MVIGVALLLVAAATATVILNFLGSIFRFEIIVPVVNLVIFMLLAMLSISLIYKILPDVKVSWGDVWLGAAITTVLIIIGALIFGWYLTSSHVSSAFEAAGTVAVILIGIYTVAEIFLFGAVFTRVYANMFGSLSARTDGDVSTGEVS